ncbi:MAG: dipeptidase [Gaiellaceae bacterium]|nr:dipeptidase [Gaiellaceae bacterium]
MKLLLTSGGIKNTSIRDALVELLGKPIAESTALFVPTAIYPFPGGAGMAWKAISGNSPSPLCDLGWKSVGVLELTALPTIRPESWVPTLRETDALLVFGGDVLYLRHWMQASGLADLLPSLSETVYVGLSAGSIVLTPYNCDAEFNLQFVPEGSDMGEDAGAGLGLVDFALRVHLDRKGEGFEDSTLAEVEKWAAGIPAPTYAIDDETAIKVTDETAEVVSEGNWKLLTPDADAA